MKVFLADIMPEPCVSVAFFAGEGTVEDNLIENKHRNCACVMIVIANPGVIEVLTM